MMKKQFCRPAAWVIIFGLCCFLSPLLPAAPGDEISRNVIRAFMDAGIPVLERSIEPVEFSLPLLDGKMQKLSDLHGKVVFLNFWATWCGPCRSEMPSMEALYKQFRTEGLEVLAVNVGEDAAQVSRFMRSNKLSFPAALDKSGAVGEEYAVQAIPTTYILDRQGAVIARIVGSINWNNPKIFAAFDTLLKSR